MKPREVVLCGGSDEWKGGGAEGGRRRGDSARAPAGAFFSSVQTCFRR
jgi:hypothetical protein